MSNYLNSEIYRVTHSKETYFLVAGYGVAAVLVDVLLLIFSAQDVTTQYLFSSMIDCIKLICFLCITVSSVVFAGESKIHTLKNTVAYGISKGEIFFGRLITELLVAFSCFVSGLGAYIACGYIMFTHSNSLYTIQLIKGMIGAVPIFVLFVVLAHTLYFIIDNESIIMIIWFVIIGRIPIISLLLESKIELVEKIADYIPWFILSDYSVNRKTGEYILGWTTNEGIIKCLLVGIIGSVVCYIIGLMVFKRKEIK